MTSSQLLPPIFFALCLPTYHLMFVCVNECKTTLVFTVFQSEQFRLKIQVNFTRVKVHFRTVSVSSFDLFLNPVLV